MTIKINDKEYPFDGYAHPKESLLKVVIECYEQGRRDEREKIFAWLKTKDLRFGDKETLQELYEFEEQLKEQSDD